MNKEKLFAYVEAMWNRLEEAEEFFGMDDNYVKMERARWQGAFGALKAAGLLDDYREYQADRIREEIK